MRNLKKFLALVLAMVMAFSLMMTANATDISKFGDGDTVKDEFVESVAVLTGLDVIKGDGEGETKNIRPQDEVTRAEAAALVYRIVTGDINDAQVKLYSDYGKFTDVSPDAWYAGYVGYCANQGIIKGRTATTFDPSGKVTGYEVLAMILRADGYGKNNEFTGSDWQVNVASLAKTKHISDSVTSALYDYTLNMNARREIVAELLFRGAMIPQVTWSSALGYNDKDSVITVTGTWTNNQTLMQEVFDLYRGGWEFGAWGRPQITWKADRNPSKDRTVATLKAEPYKSFTDLQRECDVAEMLDITTQDTFILFVDAANNAAGRPIPVTNNYLIKATDTVTKVGGYGRITEIYTQEDLDKQFPWHSTATYWNNGEDEFTRLGTDIIVMIDTYLAKVVNKSECVKDAAGHVITPARLTVDLYDVNGNVADRRIISKPAASDASWDFAIGDVISLKGRSTQTGNSGNEAWAFTLPQVMTGTTNNGTAVLMENTHVFDLKKLDGVQGKQTTVYWNNGKHQVDGQDKTDDLALRMDKAGNNINTTYTWYYDDYGYLLGIDDGSKVNYGVITSVYVAYGANETTDGVGQAIATVKYADGTTGTETIDYFMVNGTAAKVRNVSRQMTSTANTVQLFPVYNVSSNDPMLEQTGTAFDTAAIASAVCAQKGVVFMAPVAASNTQAATKTTYSVNNIHGILNDNLFKFIKTAGDKTVAVEVAGGWNVDGNNDGTMDGVDFTLASGNTGDFAGNWNAQTSDSPKLDKSLAYITRNGKTGAQNVVAWLDDETQIMVRNPNNGTISCYDGVSALPGNVTLTVAAAGTEQANRKMNEIDWADTDNDGRAEYVYLTGTIQGVTTYGLFYTNDLTASWDGSKAVMHGFWNGAETDLTFTSLALFNQVKNAMVRTATTPVSYNGHLFAIKQIAGVVNDVMVKNDSGNFIEELLGDDGVGNTSGETFALSDKGGTPTKYILTSAAGHAADWMFGDGTDAGFAGVNPYTKHTEAVYWTDDGVTSAVGNTPVVYNASYDRTLLGATVTVTENGGDTNGDSVTSYTYHLNPSSKVYGIGSNVVLAEGATALEYLNHSVTNHVTIVYELENGTNSRSVLEMYIQTDPNITPSGAVGSWYVPTITATGGSVTVANLGHGGSNGASYDFTVNIYMTTTAGARSLISSQSFTKAAGDAAVTATVSAPSTSGYVYSYEVISGDSVVASGIVVCP